MQRPCLTCGVLTATGSRCPAHTMSSTTARGYGAPHQRLRRAIAVQVDAGQALCTRCGQLIEPGSAWDLDHTDDRSGYLGPAHAAHNRGARP